MKKLYMIDCIATHHIRYCVETEDTSQIGEIIRLIDEGDNELTEFSQDYLGEKVVTTSHIISEEEYLKVFDEDNDYLKEWDKEKKLEFINKIDESK